MCRHGDEAQGGGRGLPWPPLPLGKDGAAHPEMLRLGREHLWSAGKVESSVLDLTGFELPIRQRGREADSNVGSGGQGRSLG